jgi:hypothetical protein
MLSPSINTEPGSCTTRPADMGSTMPPLMSVTITARYRPDP